MLRLASFFAFLLAATVALAQQQPATLTVTPGSQPEVLQVLDSSGAWAQMGTIDPLGHTFTPVSGGGGGGGVYSNHGALVAAAASSTTATMHQAGFSNPGDGGWAFYDYQSGSTAAVNDPLVLAGAAGRYVMRTDGVSFRVDAFGAKGDHAIGSDGSITAGSNVFTTITTTFTPADVGKQLWLFYGGTPAPIGAPATPTQFTPSSGNLSVMSYGLAMCYPRGTLVWANPVTVQETYLGSGGETPASSSMSLTCDSSTVPMVTSPLPRYGAVYYNVYLNGLLQNWAPIKIGSPWWMPIYGLDAVGVNGAVPPSTDSTMATPPLFTTIAAYVSAHQVTLAVNAGATVSGSNFGYATDDGAAFAAAAAACGALGNLGGVTGFGGGRITLGQKQYLIYGTQLSVPPGCEIGNGTLISTQMANASATQPAQRQLPAILLDTVNHPNNANTILLGNGSKWTGVSLFQWGKPQGTSAANSMTSRIGVDSESNDVGDGITPSTAAYVSDILGIGFDRLVHVSAAQRDYFSDCFFASRWGIWIDHSHDPADLTRCEGWSFYNSNGSWGETIWSVANIIDSGDAQHHIQINAASQVNNTPGPGSTLKFDDVVRIQSVTGYSGANNRFPVLSATAGVVDGSFTASWAVGQSATKASTAIATGNNGGTQTCGAGSTCGLPCTYYIQGGTAASPAIFTAPNTSSTTGALQGGANQVLVDGGNYSPGGLPGTSGGGGTTTGVTVVGATAAQAAADPTGSTYACPTLTGASITVTWSSSASGLMSVTAVASGQICVNETLAGNGIAAGKIVSSVPGGGICNNIPGNYGISAGNSHASGPMTSLYDKIVLGASTTQPTPTCTWGKWSNAARCSQLNSMAANQTVSDNGANTIGPNGTGTNTIRGIDPQTGDIMLAALTSGAGSAAITVTNGAYAGGGKLNYGPDLHGGAAFYISDSQGYDLTASNAFGYAMKIWGAQVSTSDKLGQAKFIGFTCDSNYDPNVICLLITNDTNAVAPGALKWYGGSVSVGPGQPFILDGGLLNSAAVQISSLHVAPNQTTQLVGGVISGRLDWAVGDVSTNGNNIAMLDLPTASEVHISAGSLPTVEPALVSTGQKNIYFSEDTTMTIPQAVNSGSCGITNQLGGNSPGVWNGSFQLSAPSGACAGGTGTVVLNFMLGASSGFVCDAHDLTTPTATVQQNATSTVGMAAFNVTGGVANDLITYGCRRF